MFTDRPLSRFCLLLSLALAVGVCLVGPACSQSLITNRGALASRDHLDWAALGDHATRISDPFSLISSQGTAVFVSQTGHGLSNQFGGTFSTLRQAGAPQAEGTLNGNFAPGDLLLDAQDGGAVSLAFPQGVYGGGAQIAVPLPTTSGAGVFTVLIQAFGRDNTLLASFTKSGTFSAKSDNSALFLGIVDTSPDIYRISYTGTTAHYSLFLNRFDIAPPQAAPSIGQTHVLWANTDGRASIWSYNAVTGTFTQNSYGPYNDGSPNAIWRPMALATGPDGLSRLLWTNPDGRVMLWSVDDVGHFSSAVYGPYTDPDYNPSIRPSALRPSTIITPRTPWSAQALSVGTDNVTHILWTNTDGRASVWNYNAIGDAFTQNSYGPYTGWAAKSIADGPDGRTRVLWTTAAGQVSLWSLDNRAGVYIHHEFGPYTGWIAGAVSVGQGNTTHLLWTNVSGQLSLWNYDAVTGVFGYMNYGPFGGWTPQAVADGPDGKTRVLWDNADGQASIWSLDNTDGIYIHHEFGPYTGWTAVAASAP